LLFFPTSPLFPSFPIFLWLHLIISLLYRSIFIWSSPKSLQQESRGVHVWRSEVVLLSGTLCTYFTSGRHPIPLTSSC
jgi:hypothetical protein